MIQRKSFVQPLLLQADGDCSLFAVPGMTPTETEARVHPTRPSPQHRHGTKRPSDMAVAVSECLAQAECEDEPSLGGRRRYARHPPCGRSRQHGPPVTMRGDAGSCMERTVSLGLDVCVGGQPRHLGVSDSLPILHAHRWRRSHGGRPRTRAQLGLQTQMHMDDGALFERRGCQRFGTPAVHT